MGNNPRMSPPRVPDAPQPPAALSSKGRVLVVDDDRLVLATVAQGLADAGYEVIDADNGDDAILLARRHRPELALLDIRMPGMTGFDVAETLRDKYGIPFMFLSAFSDERTLATVETLGALAYLVKPLEVGQIVPAVEAAFGRARRQGTAVAKAAAAAPSAAEGPQPAAGPTADPLADPVPVAIGVLMHRFSLTRAQALQRLHRQAGEQGVAPAQQAERVLAAVEQLSG
jgi:DNA-binding response OmpR family regulator